MTSRYLDYLPATFREKPFAGQLLLAFEALLAGADGVTGIEETIEGSASYLHLTDTPEDFLPWLAGWVALNLRADWDSDTKRGFIREVVPLYRERGTLSGLRRMLQIYLRPLGGDVERSDVVIYDDFAEVPHYFQVRLTLGDADRDRLREVQEVARAIIDQEKPAHTCYALKVVVPTMRIVSEELRAAENNIPKLLIVGENTRLGTEDLD